MIIKNSKIPSMLSIFIDVYAITLWPFIFIKDNGNIETIAHEKIHLRQQVELGIIGFYILYASFYLYYYWKLRDNNKAYFAIPFEKEAYTASKGGDVYLSKRNFLEWLNYL